MRGVFKFGDRVRFTKDSTAPIDSDSCVQVERNTLGTVVSVVDNLINVKLQNPITLEDDRSLDIVSVPLEADILKGLQNVSEGFGIKDIHDLVDYIVR